MTTELDFYYDFGSPTAYLAYRRLGQLQQQYDLAVNNMPILLGGIFKATGNNSPVAIPAKGNYMLQHDLPRFARRYDVPLNFNPHFPINTLNLMRGAIAAERLGCSDSYMAIVYEAVWVDSKNMGDPEVAAAVLADGKLDAAALMELSQDPAVKAELVSRTEAAVERGLFGVPTLFIDKEMYFGQDRLDFIEEALQS
jgi:2-hydroxychromene-2-carboxylate isomerase